MPERTSPESWRRRLRISVRGLIALVLVVGVWMGWLARSARIQRDSVAAIRAAGGVVYYNFQLNGGKFSPVATPWAPEWMVDALGIDLLANVVAVRFPSANSDADLAQIGALSGLVELQIAGASVTDRGLAHLEWLIGLKSLNLKGSMVTDAGLRHLNRLTRLERLDISNTRVTDAGLPHLSRMTNLVQLETSNTRISARGLEDFYTHVMEMR